MSGRRSVAILGLVATCGVAITLGLQHLTAQRIAEEQRWTQSRQWLAVLSADRYDNQPLEQPLPLTRVTLGDSTLLAAYLATLAGQPSAVLLHSRTAGYGGTIELLIAIGSNGKLLGVKTLKQTETQGLGGQIAQPGSAWLAGFQGRSLEDSRWALKKDQGQFDQVAGATITSRAVINAVHEALRYFDEHRLQLTGQQP